MVLFIFSITFIYTFEDDTNAPSKEEHSDPHKGDGNILPIKREPSDGDVKSDAKKRRDQSFISVARYNSHHIDS